MGWLAMFGASECFGDLIWWLPKPTGRAPKRGSWLVFFFWVDSRWCDSWGLASMYTWDLRLGIPTLLKNPKLIMALRWWVTTQINNVAKVHGSHFKKEVFYHTNFVAKMPPPKECHTYGLWKRFLITLASIDIKFSLLSLEKRHWKNKIWIFFFGTYGQTV